MGELDEVGEPEGSGAALDRVHGAKRAVDVLGRGAAVAERGEVAFEQADELVAFVEVDVADFGERVHAGRPLVVACGPEEEGGSGRGRTGGPAARGRA
jgi:hypothetical protein